MPYRTRSLMITPTPKMYERILSIALWAFVGLTLTLTLIWTIAFILSLA